MNNLKYNIGFSLGDPSMNDYCISKEFYYIIMKIKELLYKTPEMTEERLLDIMNEDIILFRDRNLLKRVQDLHKELPLSKALLEEYDLVQDKKSYLTNSQRKFVCGFVGFCMIQMTRDNGGKSKSESEQSAS